MEWTHCWWIIRYLWSIPLPSFVENFCKLGKNSKTVQISSFNIFHFLASISVAELYIQLVGLFLQLIGNFSQNLV
jgi:hypothetical protein